MGVRIESERSRGECARLHGCPSWNWRSKPWESTALPPFVSSTYELETSSPAARSSRAPR
jgi:hypothetical protein